MDHVTFAYFRSPQRRWGNGAKLSRWMHYSLNATWCGPEMQKQFNIYLNGRHINATVP